MDVAEGATYHVERAGTDGSDLAVVFEPPQKSSTVMLTPAPAAGAAASRSLIFRSSRPSPTPRRSRRATMPPGRSRRLRPLRVGLDSRAGTAPLSAARRLRRRQHVALRRLHEQARAAQPPQRRRRRRAPTAQQIITAARARSKYKGTPITLDFSGADLRSVLPLLQ